jgi:glutaminase
VPDPAVSRSIQERLHELYDSHVPVGDGEVHRFYAPGRGFYGPDEASGEQDTFAISLVSADDGEVYSAGDHTERFALQSLSKVFAYALALHDLGREHVLEHVGVAPSGDAYNSIVFDERHNRPHNPMVNAGALVTTSLVEGADEAERIDRIVAGMRGYAANPDLAVDEEVFAREMSLTDHNRAAAYLMRSQGMIDGDVEALLELYLRQCSVTVTCDDLGMMAATLANGGINPRTGETVLSQPRVRDVLSVMYTCGMYDFAGEWAFEVGVPAKSGVSGGVLAVIPGKMGIAVYSPGLDEYGNSVRGTRVCRQISTRLGLHVFAVEDEDVMMRPA